MVDKDTKQYLSLLGGIAVAGASTVVTMESLPEKVFEGEIDGMHIVYEEGVFSGGHGFNLDNVMIIQVGDTTYTLVDRDDETPLDWRHISTDLPTFEGNERLEAVHIRGPPNENGLRNLRTYDNRGESRTTFGYLIDSAEKLEHKARVFEKADKLYNDLRERIREIKSSEYESALWESERERSNFYREIEDSIPQLERSE